MYYLVASSNTCDLSNIAEVHDETSENGSIIQHLVTLHAGNGTENLI